MFLITRFALGFFATATVMGCAPECTSEAGGGPEAVQGIALWRTSRGMLLHWTSDTVRIPVDPALTAKYGASFPALLERAAWEWAFDPSLPLLTFDLSPTDDDRAAADAKTGNWLGLMEGGLVADKLAITVSTADSHSGAIISAQVWVNAHRPLAELPATGPSPSPGQFDLQGVLTHEFGHVLGLGEGREGDPATMNPNFKSGETHQRTVEASDEAALMRLYQQQCEH